MDDGGDGDGGDEGDGDDGEDAETGGPEEVLVGVVGVDVGGCGHVERAGTNERLWKLREECLGSILIGQDVFK